MPKLGSFFQRHITKFSTAIVAIFALVVGFFAVNFEGYAAADVELNDGGVWATNNTAGLVGHVNPKSATIDGTIVVKDANSDIFQGGDLVLEYSPGEGKVNVVDPARRVLGSDITVPLRVKDGADVIAMGGGVVGIIDPADGRVWAVPFDQLGSFDLKTAEPAFDSKDDHAVMNVGVDGRVYVAAPDHGAVFVITVTQTGSIDPITTIEMPGIAKTAAIEVTTVGDRVVVLDKTVNKIHLPQQAVTADVFGSDGESSAVEARLQDPGPASESVMYQTATAAVTQPIEGGAASGQQVPEGRIANPVVVAGCAYFAWSGTGTFLRDCPGTKTDRKAVIANIREQASLQIRVNRDVAVVNDVLSGDVWLTDQDLTLVNNWEEIIPPPSDDQQKDTADNNPDHIVKDWDDSNHDPTAKDDAFGARAGRSTILPVLDNDTDEDGDVLAAVVRREPTEGRVSQIYGGGALQLELPADADGAIEFEYEVNDGRGGVAQASVVVTVFPDDVNTAPKQHATRNTQVALGGSVELNVLPDFHDPEGDTLYLAGAEIDGESSVRFTQDGTVTYTDTALGTGPKTIRLTVADERGETVDGVTTVTIKPDGVRPLAVADHVRGIVGAAVVVTPLANDISPSGAQLTLAQVDQKGNEESRADNQLAVDIPAGTFSYTAASPGTYHFTYAVSAGSESENGRVRIDIVASSESTLPPVAVRDVTMFRAGQDNLVNVLANDSDPSGGVLVTQSVSLPEDSGMQASVVDNENILLRAPGGLTQPVTAQYTVANANGSATADILIVPLPAPERALPPVAVDDIASVRAGDYVTIPVLANDSHPSGEEFSLVRNLVDQPDPTQGMAFTSSESVRFYANKNASGQAFVTYQIVGDDGISEFDSARVTINIVERDDEFNAPPRPENITARTISDSVKRIVVPMDGLDPDGDHVSMVGIESTPSLGRVVSYGDGYIDYESDKESVGVDSFSYSLTDRLGARATGTVTVGIVAQSSDNSAPVAVDDVFTLRPKRTVDLNVLNNDIDPDGDALVLVDDSLTRLSGDVSRLSAAGDLMRIRTGGLGTSTLEYQVSDGRGGVDEATVAVAITEDAVLQAPIARDDYVQPSSIVGKSSVVVDVTHNDLDPDGVSAELVVKSDHPTAKVVKGNRFEIQVMAEPQIIQYYVTDVDDLMTSAFIEVPGTGSQYPTLKVKSRDATVVSGMELRLPLVDYVNVAPGKSPRLTSLQSITAPLAGPGELAVDETTLLFRSRENYFGPASVTFEVTDGASAEDPEGHRALLTIPITVTPLDDQAPAFTNNTVRVAPGEDAVTLDLRGSTKAPGDPRDSTKARDARATERLKYEITQDPVGGVKATLTGSKLRLEAEGTAARGATTSVGIGVRYSDSETTAGVVTVVVTDTLKAKPKANDDILGEMKQGEARTVDVLANDYDPTPDRGLTLTIKPIVETGNASATIRDGKIVVTPDASYIGSIIVRYVMVDATKDPERESSARIRAVVVGRPDQPGVPSVISAADRQVVLSWSPPPANGAPITGYTVTSTAGGGYSQSCPATTCNLTGLSNNVEYSFRVIATNRVGNSAPSPVSAPVRPDVRPDAPAAPQLAFGDKSLNITWAAPSSLGSPIVGYILEITPADTKGATQKTVTSTAVVWDSLENGRPYRVRVKANNRADQPSEFSAYSRDETPAGKPVAPRAPVLRQIPAFGDDTSISVTWTAPQDNGAAITEYVITPGGAGEGDAPVTVPGNQTSVEFPVRTASASYTFKVAAMNKAGLSEASPDGSIRATSAPGPVTGLTAEDRDRSAALSLSMNPRDLHGAQPAEISYRYRIGGSGWQSLGADRVIPGLVNNNTYQVQVVAVATINGTVHVNDSGDNIRNVTVRPYGLPGVTTVSVADDGTGAGVTVSWNASGARNGRDIVNAKIQLKIDGADAGFETLAVGGSKHYSAPPRSNVQAVAIAVDELGQNGPTASASVTVKDPGVISITQDGDATGEPECAVTECYFISLKSDRIAAGSYNFHVVLGTGTVRDFQQTIPATDATRLLDATGRPLVVDRGSRVQITMTNKDLPGVVYTFDGYLS